MALDARDGSVGRVSELLVDDDGWAVRWIVVDTGRRPADRRVLLSPRAVERLDDDGQALVAALTLAQVEGSPPAGEGRLTRRAERDLHEFFGWPFYWGGVGPGAVLAPGAVADAPADRPGEPGAPGEGEPHLHDTADLMGARVVARDGEAGRVADLIVKLDAWRIAALVVDTRAWRPGPHSAVPAGAVTAVDAAEGVIALDLTREQVARTPGPAG